MRDDYFFWSWFRGGNRGPRNKRLALVANHIEGCRHGHPCDASSLLPWILRRQLKDDAVSVSAFGGGRPVQVALLVEDQAAACRPSALTAIEFMDAAVFPMAVRPRR